MKQLIQNYKEETIVEDFVDKLLNKNSTNIYDVDGLYYKSQYLQENYKVQYYNSDVVGLLGDNEIIIDMIITISESMIVS